MKNDNKNKIRKKNVETSDEFEEYEEPEKWYNQVSIVLNTKNSFQGSLNDP